MTPHQWFSNWKCYNSPIFIELAKFVGDYFHLELLVNSVFEMKLKIVVSLLDIKQIIFAVDFFLLFFSGDLFGIGDGYQIKADVVRGFKISPNVSISLVQEYNNYDEPRCYHHLYEDLCTAITYKKKEQKCLKNLYGRVFLVADVESETWLKSVFHWCVLV